MMLGRLWVVTLLSLGLMACHPQPPATPVTLEGIAYFSMPWSVKIAQLPAGVTAPQLQKQCQDTLDHANQVLSTYQSTSELMLLNAMPIGQPMPLSPMLFSSLRTAMQVSQATQGVYDVTVGPLVNLWGFGPQAVPTRIPTATQISQAQARVGWQALALNGQSQQAIRQKDIQLDLSSIGEGVGVDALVAVLEQRGIHDYMASVAGTLRVSGHKAKGELWQIAIEKPDASGLPQQLLHLEGAVAVSTSGAYRNYHEIEGIRYSHTIDPRTGKPITHKGVSVTVVMPNQPAALADAWATGLNALGPDEGFALAQQQHLAAFYIRKTPQGFAEQVSPAFQSFLQPLNQH